jgi:lysophospholipase L1-like esterase
MARLAAAAGVAALVSAYYAPTSAQSADRWVGTWATAEVSRNQNPPTPSGQPGLAPFMASACAPAGGGGGRGQAAGGGAPAGPPPYVHYTDQTLRQIVRTSIGGSKARIVVSNDFGTAALNIGAASIALADKDGGIQAGSSRPLTFSGRPTITVPPGSMVYSDAVNITVPQLGDLAVDLYLPETTNTPSPVTMHTASFQTNYVSEKGNHVGKATLPNATKTQSYFYLTRVEVVSPDATGAVVTFGDSITDGTRSTPDTNSRWPNFLAGRFAAASMKMGVLNLGIAGNRVLLDGAGPNALSRFQIQALSQAGVTHVVVLEAINDIGQARQNPTPTADDLIAGHKQLVDRAHAAGLKIYGATLTPYYGAAYYTDIGEAKRQAVNEWIRTSKAYDGVIDFDKVTRDPSNPKMFLPAYDSCDHLHPNDAGYKAMAESIDLSLFKATTMRTSSSSSR